MVPFGGWDMPVEYSGIVNEHLAVRTKAGLFDVSHMGEIELAGKDALAAVQKISANDAAKLSVGQAQYSALTTPAGTFVDDLIVYRLAKEHYMLVVNAGNIEKAYKWIGEHARPVGDVAVVNSSSRYALLAVQGPAAVVHRSGTYDGRSCLYQVLLVRSRRSGGRAEHHLAHRVHGRGWLRAVYSARIGRARVECDSRGRRRSRHRAGWPGCARYAAARGGHAPVGSGHRRDHDRARGRLGMDRRLEEGRLHRQGRARAAKERRADTQARGIRDDGSGDRASWL